MNFYDDIICPLMGVSNQSKYTLAYEVRPRFAHNYERQVFLDKRAKFIVSPDSWVILLKADNHHVIVYRDAISHLGLKLKDLIWALKEFYSVEVQDLSPVKMVDVSNSGYEDRRDIYEI